MRYYNPQDGSSVSVEDEDEALQQGLLPSVTTILSVIASPGLDDWYTKQALDYYCRTGDYDGALEYEDNRSSVFGTTCHQLIHAFLSGTACSEQHDERHRDAVQPLCDWIDRNVSGRRLFSEESFADVELGYGGTADLLVRLNSGRLLLCDVKCKKNSERYPMQPSICYKYQLSAYRQHFRKHYGEMWIANLLLASPFGYDDTPCLTLWDYQDQDWTAGFEAAHLLWREQVEDGA